MAPILLVLLLALAQTAPTEADHWRDLLRANRDTEAVAAVQASAAKNDPVALDFLAWFYDNGRGVTHDATMAARIYRQAAEAGDKHAQWRLGVMLDKGEGVAADPAEAVRWFEKSAAQGFTNAFTSIGVMYSTGRGVPQDNAKALASYQEAARRHNVHAFNEIGTIYANGEGVPVDHIEAAAWIIIAASYGDEVAKQHLQQVGTGFEKADWDRAAARATEISKEYKLDQ
jgi:TPR repeat protein